jgi:two-component system chemotaxis sensor kinase CheA
MSKQNQLDLFSKTWLQLPLKAKKKSLSSFSSLEDLFVIFVIKDDELLKIAAEEINKLGLEFLKTKNTFEAVDWITKYGSRVILFVTDISLLTQEGFEFRRAVVESTNDTPFVLLADKIKHEELSDEQFEFRAHGSFIVDDFKTELWFHFLRIDLISRVSFLAEEIKHRLPYIQNAQNILLQTEELILSLEESSETSELLDTIFGNIHTLKGGSGFLQPKTLHKFMHSFEDHINKLQSKLLSVNSDQITLMLKVLDQAKVLLDDLNADFHQVYTPNELEKLFQVETYLKSAERPAHQVFKSKEDKSLKVPISLLDTLMHISGELTVVRNMINKIDRNLKIKNAEDKEYERMSALLEELHRLNGNIQKHVLDLRKVPVKDVVAPLNRLVRDVSKQLGKLVTLKIDGGNLRIDTFLAEVLNNSLIHLVRNSIDHGFETPAQRKNKGKTQNGSLLIQFTQEKEHVYVKIVDDGRGMQTELIKKRALERGLISKAKVDEMTNDEIFRLIFAAGFSTADKVTDISGRGIGMSAVKESVEGIGGEIVIDSVPDQGTTMKLVLPLPKSVLIARCIFVVISDLQIGINSENIYRFIHLDHKDKDLKILKVENYFLLSLDEEIVPIMDLRPVLGVKSREEVVLKTVVVLQNSVGLKMGIIVNELLEFENTVVKPFTDFLKTFDIFFGTTFLGDGSIGLIFNIDGLFNILGRNSKTSHKIASPKINSEAA